TPHMLGSPTDAETAASATTIDSLGSGGKKPSIVQSASTMGSTHTEPALALRNSLIASTTAPPPSRLAPDDRQTSRAVRRFPRCLQPGHVGSQQGVAHERHDVEDR